ncbi:MAG: hypothetical protein WKG32_12580 [Gemmatimonadaceae bacterium]
MSATDGHGSGGPPEAEADRFTVQVYDADGAAAYLWVLSRPAGSGVPGADVRVQEWSAENWTGAPAELTLPGAEVYARVRDAYDRRRRVSVELEALRAWLDAARR